MKQLSQFKLNSLVGNKNAYITEISQRYMRYINI